MQIAVPAWLLRTDVLQRLDYITRRGLSAQETPAVPRNLNLHRVPKVILGPVNPANDQAKGSLVDLSREQITLKHMHKAARLEQRVEGRIIDSGLSPPNQIRCPAMFPT